MPATLKEALQKAGHFNRNHQAAAATLEGFYRSGDPETVKAIQEAIAKGQGLSDDQIRKAITVSTGFVMTNHEQGYQDLVPMSFSWFRERVHRNPNLEGSGIAWKTLTARDSNGILGYVPEGKRAGAVQMTKGDGTASITTWGVEDSYTQEAANQGGSQLGQGGVEDLCIANLLQNFAEKEERMLFGANRDIDLGTPAAPTAAAASGGTLAADDYWCKVVALTVDGWTLASSDMSVGLTKQQSITSPAGETYTLNGGCSKVGTVSLALAATLNQKLTISVDAIQGAVAYAWFIGKNTTTAPADSAFYLHAVTTVNQFVLGATGGTPYATTGQALSALALSTTDWSKETLAPGGIFYQAMNSSDAYYLSMDNGPLTMTNGRVDQFITLFQSMFETQGIGPEALHMSPSTYMHVEKLAFSSSNPRTMFVVEDIRIQSGLILGSMVVGIKNPFTGEVVDIVINRNVPNSMIFAARLTYPVPGVASNRSVEVETFGGLWRIDWNPVTRENFHGAYMQGGIKVYVPGCFGAICNIDHTA